MGNYIYLIIMGILDCWLGIILYIAAIAKKSAKYFKIGLWVQGLCLLGLLLPQITAKQIGVDVISGCIFFILFSIFTWQIVNKSRKG